MPPLPVSLIVRQIKKRFLIVVNANGMESADLLLTREASLAAMSLGVGLTHVGKYNYTATGFFYSGMFSLCIGLERVLKLIIIDEFRLRNGGDFPSNKNLKEGYGHKIDDLLNSALNFARNYRLDVDFSIQNDEVYRPIVSFLTDFAHKARYYNLDTLTGCAQPGNEPLVRWDKEVSSIIIGRHYRPTKRRQQEMKMVAQIMSPFTMVRHTVDDGRQINDMFSEVQESAKIATKQKYGRYYLYQIVRMVCDIQRELEYKGNFFPYLREFFSIFVNTDRDWILSRKTWNPFPPYHF